MCDSRSPRGWWVTGGGRFSTRKQEVFFWLFTDLQKSGHTFPFKWDLSRSYILSMTDNLSLKSKKNFFLPISLATHQWMKTVILRWFVYSLSCCQTRTSSYLSRLNDHRDASLWQTVTHKAVLVVNFTDIPRRPCYYIDKEQHCSVFYLICCSTWTLLNAHYGVLGEDSAQRRNERCFSPADNVYAPFSEGSITPPLCLRHIKHTDML